MPDPPDHRPAVADHVDRLTAEVAAAPRPSWTVLRRAAVRRRRRRLAVNGAAVAVGVVAVAMTATTASRAPASSSGDGAPPASQVSTGPDDSPFLPGTAFSLPEFPARLAGDQALLSGRLRFDGDGCPSVVRGESVTPVAFVAGVFVGRRTADGEVQVVDAATGLPVAIDGGLVALGGRGGNEVGSPCGSSRSAFYVGEVGAPSMLAPLLDRPCVTGGSAALSRAEAVDRARQGAGGDEVPAVAARGPVSAVGGDPTLPADRCVWVVTLDTPFVSRHGPNDRPGPPPVTPRSTVVLLDSGAVRGHTGAVDLLTQQGWPG